MSRETAPLPRFTRAALLAGAALLAAPARAADSACDALAPADLAGLGFQGVKPGSAHAPGKVVSLDSTAAISGRETECLWTASPGSVTLILGDMDANLVKGDDIKRLGQKVLGSVREKMETAGRYSGNAYTFSPLPGVGDEAFVARLNPTFFEVLGRRGLRLARLTLSAPPGVRRVPTPEEAWALLSRVLGGPGGYTTAGAPPVQGEAPWAGPDDRYTVTGSVVATGALSGTFTWKSPGAVETYPDRTELVLTTPDRSVTMNMQVWNAQDRVEIRSGKLQAGSSRARAGRRRWTPSAAPGSSR